MIRVSEMVCETTPKVSCAEDADAGFWGWRACGEGMLRAPTRLQVVAGVEWRVRGVEWTDVMQA